LIAAAVLHAFLLICYKSLLVTVLTLLKVRLKYKGTV